MKQRRLKLICICLLGKRHCFISMNWEFAEYFFLRSLCYVTYYIAIKKLPLVINCAFPKSQANMSIVALYWIHSSDFIVYGFRKFTVFVYFTQQNYFNMYLVPIVSVNPTINQLVRYFPVKVDDSKGFWKPYPVFLCHFGQVLLKLLEWESG